MNIHVLVDASHALGKDRGFWETDKDLREEMLYIFSNVGDIAKAFKKGRRADWVHYESALREYDFIEAETKKKDFFKTYIKDTFEDEISNVILRITDLFGGKKIDIVQSCPWIETYENTEIDYFFRNVKPTEEFDGNVAHWLNESLFLCMSSSDNSKDYGLSHILFHLGALIEFYDIDIEKHLDKKIEYNRTRPMLYKA